MGEWNPFSIDEFSWEVLKLYLKYGYGEVKLYDTTFFNHSLSDETVCLTLKQFAEKAMDYDDVLWSDKEALAKMGGKA